MSRNEKAKIPQPPSREDEPVAFQAWLVGRLAESTLFEGLGTKVLDRLAETGEVREFRKNDVVFKQGDAGDAVYVVLAGAVRISRTVPGMGEEAFAVLKTGSAFGEMVLIDDEPRSADSIAHERSKLFAIGKDELERLMFVDRTLACELLWKLVRMLGMRLRETNDKMTFLSVTGRF